MQSSFSKFDAIDRLKQSEKFSNQDLQIKILEYLAKAEEEGKNIKSTTLAIDLLGKSDGANTSVQDAFIRTKVMNLRKDLDLFYLTEGKEEEYKISIPKGAYRLLLSHRNKKNNTTAIPIQTTSKRPRSFFMISVLLVVISMICLVFSYVITQKKGDKLSSVVSLFLSKDSPLTIVVGSRGFYREYDTDLERYRFIFDSDVALPSQKSKFKKLEETHKERQIINIADKFRHVDMPNILLATELLKEWWQWGQESFIKESTAVDNAFKIKNNSLFISKMESGDLYDFTVYFEDSRCKFQTGDMNTPIYISHFIMPDSTPIHFYQQGKRNVSQYFLLKKVIAPNDKSILFLLVSNDFARDYVFSHLFDSNLQQDIIGLFEEKIPDEFELLIKIKNKASHEVIYSSVE